jgi:hypothetical protein
MNATFTIIFDLLESTREAGDGDSQEILLLSAETRPEAEEIAELRRLTAELTRPPAGTFAAT